MRNKIKQLAICLQDKDYQVLWFEIFLFAVVFGAAYQSWIAFIVIGSVLMGVLMLPRGKMWVSIAISCLWGFIAFSIGYSFGGWGSAAVCGGGLVFIGVVAHLKNIDLLTRQTVVFCDDAVFERRAPHRWMRQTFN